MKIRLTFLEPVLGTWPSNENVARDFIASKAPDASSEAKAWYCNAGYAKALLCNSWQRHCRDLMCLAKAKNSLASRRHGMLCFAMERLG